MIIKYELSKCLLLGFTETIVNQGKDIEQKTAKECDYDTLVFASGNDSTNHSNCKWTS